MIPLVVMNLAPEGELGKSTSHRLEAIAATKCTPLSRLGGALNRLVYRIPFTRGTTLDETPVRELVGLDRKF